MELLLFFNFMENLAFDPFLLLLLDELEDIFGPETWLPDLWQTLPDVHSTWPGWTLNKSWPNMRNLQELMNIFSFTESILIFLLFTLTSG